MDSSVIRILVVDDEHGICDALQTHLALDGYHVDVANSAVEALELMEAKPYQLVLTDINMPDMDGLELLQKLKELRGDVCVIMITAYTTLSKVLASRVEGAFDYVLKPFRDLGEIDEAVDRARVLLERWHAVMQQTREAKARSV
jgi:DNA-binding NtrC family response regulator